MKPETAALILSMEWVNNHFRLENGTVKALLHCAICSATCNATLKNVFVAVSEVGCYTVQCNLSNLQRFVPRKPCDIRYWRAGVGGRSDLQRNRRTLGENCVASCRRGVTLCNGSCKLLRLLQKVELDSTSCNVARNKKWCVASCRGTLLHRAILQQLATQQVAVKIAQCNRALTHRPGRSFPVSIVKLQHFCA